MPSGRFPSLLRIPDGSNLAGTVAAENERWIMSLRLLCRRRQTLTMPTAEAMCTKMVDISTTVDTLMWLAH